MIEKLRDINKELFFKTGKIHYYIVAKQYEKLAEDIYNVDSVYNLDTSSSEELGL